jgi:hypothetical protein
MNRLRKACKPNQPPTYLRTGPLSECYSLSYETLIWTPPSWSMVCLSSKPVILSLIPLRPKIEPQEWRGKREFSPFGVSLFSRRSGSEQTNLPISPRAKLNLFWPYGSFLLQCPALDCPTLPCPALCPAFPAKAEWIMNGASLGGGEGGAVTCRSCAQFRSELITLAYLM